MIDKLALNNELLAFQKVTHKGRILVTQRIIKKLAFFRKNPKFANKVNILEKELEFIKKVKAKELSKKILLSEKEPQKIITDASSSPEDRACARVSDRLKKQVNEFKTHFSLDDPENKKILANLGLKRQKKKIKKAKGQQSDTPKAEITKKSPKKSPKKAMEWIVDDIEPEENGKVEKTKPIVQEKLQKHKLKATKKPNPEPVSSDSEPEEVLMERSVDPFFVTSTGENYVAAVDLSKSQQQGEDEEIKPRAEKKSSFTRMKKPDQRNPEETKKNGDLHPSWAAKQREKKILPFQGKKKRFDDDQKASEGPTEDLHPSWAAKKKAKPTIAAFEGKKIKFED